MFLTVFSLLFNLSPSHADVAPVFCFPFITVLWYPAVTQLLLLPNPFRALCIVGRFELCFCYFYFFFSMIFGKPEDSLRVLSNDFENL